jgi:hypothetical protein
MLKKYQSIFMSIRIVIRSIYFLLCIDLFSSFYVRKKKGHTVAIRSHLNSQPFFLPAFFLGVSWSGNPIITTPMAVVIKNMPTSQHTFSFDDIARIPELVINSTDPKLLTSENISQFLVRAVHAAAEDINPSRRHCHATSPLLNPKFKSARTPSTITMYIDQELNDNKFSYEQDDPSVPLFGMADTDFSYPSHTHSQLPSSSSIEFKQPERIAYEYANQTNQPYPTHQITPSNPHNHTDTIGNETVNAIETPLQIDFNSPLSLEAILPTINSSIERLERKLADQISRSAKISSIPHFHPTPEITPPFIPSRVDKDYLPSPILPLSTLTFPATPLGESAIKSFDELKLLQHNRYSDPLSKLSVRSNNDHLQSIKRAPSEYWTGETFDVPCQRWDPLCCLGLPSSIPLTCSVDCGIWSTQLALRINMHHGDLIAAMHSVSSGSKFDQMFPKHAGSSDRWVMADRLIHLFHHMPTYIHMINNPSDLGHRLCSALRSQVQQYPFLQTSLMSCQAEHDILMAKIVTKSAISADIRFLQNDLRSLQADVKDLRSHQDEQQKQLVLIRKQLKKIANQRRKCTVTSLLPSSPTAIQPNAKRKKATISGNFKTRKKKKVDAEIQDIDSWRSSTDSRKRKRVKNTQSRQRQKPMI